LSSPAARLIYTTSWDTTHGMVFRTAEGGLVTVKSHLLRHLFATHAVHVEKFPVDIVGQWLHQRDIGVTHYYSRPTDVILAAEHERYLSRFAAHVDLRTTVRTPDELRRATQEAIEQMGMLTRVIGGECVAQGRCPIQFQCVGCGMNAPDPGRRSEVLEKKDYALDQRDRHLRRGQLAEARRMEAHVRDCDTMLREMDLIEEYRRDEQRRVFISIEDIEASTDMARKRRVRAETSKNSGPDRTER